VRETRPLTVDPESCDDAKATRLQELLHVHSQRLLGYITAKIPAELRAYVETQDVLQDTFFEAFQRIAEFEPRTEDGGYAWLVTIARHRMLAIIRMRRAAKRGANAQMHFQGDDDVIQILQSLAIYSRTPSQSAMSHEVALAITESMSRIEPQYREVIQLRFLEGMSVKQSAERMGRSEAAILSLCRRGLDAMREQLRAVSLVA
jgi:RNA polymerase sigma-70 factor (ECF subfamily)